MEAAELQATLRLVAGLLVPCVALLCCLNGLLLLRRRSLGWQPPPWPGGPPRQRDEAQQQQRPPTPPWRVVVSGGSRGPEAAAAAVAGGSAGPSRPRPCLCARGLPPAASAASSSDLDRRPLLVPPNSPAGSSWAARGLPGSASGRQHSSTQRRVPRGRPAFPARLHPSPFEYGSSIRREDRPTQLSSANLTASPGPGLDSDFGASAGVSLRILSSDSDESPTVPLLHARQSGRFEWDYYDPSYKKSAPLQPHLPGICSKQYWL
ncbi:UNVERIFIED_CONTAM: hypothetical protein K2H54_068247 [Gekko kuhli]